MGFALQWPESHSENSTTVEAIVDGVSTRADVLAEIVANAPWSYGGLLFNRVESADNFDGHTDVWKARIRYAAFREKKELQEGENEFNFGSGNRTITRTFSISSKVYDSSGDVTGSTPDAQIIGYRQDTNSAEGVQVTEYINSFSWRVAVPFSTASESWRRDAGALKGSVCDSGFFGYSAGEVLFKDITGSVKGDGLYVFRLDFMQGKNPGEITIGGITVPDVEFWDHLDIDDQDLELANGIYVPKVRRVKVHQVKYKKSWALLSAVLGFV